MAIVLVVETGFVMTEQMPCLKLNARSITPENDVAMRLFKPCPEWELCVPIRRVSALARCV